ncbi:MAG TPA: hypothetical protein VGM87_09405 [Roseomonas sp.]
MLIVIAGTALVPGCGLVSRNDSQVTPVARFLPPGWNCLATPSAFDGPGSIFRVAADSTKFTVGDFAAQAGVRREQFAAPTATQTVETGAGVIAQIIGLPLSAEAAASERYSVEQTFGGAEELNTTDDSVSAIIEAFYARRDLDRNQRYFLVRRAIVARSVQYAFNRDVSASLGVDLAVEVARIRPSARYSRTNGFRYEDTFAQPQNVCVVAQPLPVPRPPPAVRASPPPAPPDNVPLFRSAARGTR